MDYTSLGLYAGAAFTCWGIGYAAGALMSFISRLLEASV